RAEEACPKEPVGWQGNLPGLAQPPLHQVASTERSPAHRFADADRTADSNRRRLAETLEQLPEVGTVFHGFHLVAELGRGAFGRVYLARQGDLANRFVALKVAVQTAGEAHALAQMQHTNIV